MNPKQGFHTGDKNSLSGVGGHQLEFLYLAQITNNLSFVDRISKVRKFMQKKIQKQHYGTDVGYMDMVDVQQGDWFYTSYLSAPSQALTLSLFANGRDYYRSLLASYIQSRGKDLEAIEMFKQAIQMAIRIKVRQCNGLYFASSSIHSNPPPFLAILQIQFKPYLCPTILLQHRWTQ